MYNWIRINLRVKDRKENFWIFFFYLISFNFFSIENFNSKTFLFKTFLKTPKYVNDFCDEIEQIINVEYFNQSTLDFSRKSPSSEIKIINNNNNI